MKTVTTRLKDRDQYAVRSRRDNRKYTLDLDGMMKINELINFYNESIYYMPDDVTVRAYTLDDTYQPVELQVNELIFT
jgi:hypothetical protein